MTRRSRPSAGTLATLLLCASAAASSAVNAVAGDVQSLEAIEQRVRQAIVERAAGATDLQVDVTPVDRRLRLPACGAPLDAEIAGEGVLLGRRSVEVSCPDAPAWRVRVSATVSQSVEAWALARPVQRGEVLTRAHLVRQTLRLGSQDARALRAGAAADDVVRVNARSPESSLDGLLGQVFERGMGEGRLLVRRSLKAPVLVKRGRGVRMRYRGAGVSIEAVGTALADGRSGERISVKNEVTGIAVDATVVSRDEVVIR